jgi:hypothetical protein
VKDSKAEGTERYVLVGTDRQDTKRRSRRGRRLKGRHKGIAYVNCLETNELPMSLNDSL